MSLGICGTQTRYYNMLFCTNQFFKIMSRWPLLRGGGKWVICRSVVGTRPSSVNLMTVKILTNVFHRTDWYFYMGSYNEAIKAVDWKFIDLPFARLGPLSILKARMRTPFKYLGTILLGCTGSFGGGGVTFFF